MYATRELGVSITHLLSMASSTSIARIAVIVHTQCSCLCWLATL